MSPQTAPPKNQPQVVDPDTITDVKPKALLAGEKRGIRGVGDLGLDAIKLKGRPWRANITAAVQDALVGRTMDGASTLTLKLLDPAGHVRNHPILEEQTEVEVDGLWFSFVGASADDDGLTLIFEDREIAILRRLKGPIKAYRDQMTRAEFVGSLVTRAGIPAFIPEIHVKQPIAKGQKPQQTPKPAASEPQPAARTKASAKAAKGITGVVTPVQVGQAMLAAGWPAKWPIIAQGIAIVRCESNFDGEAVNPTYGKCGYWGEIGTFQQAYNCPSPECVTDLLLSTQAAKRSYDNNLWGAWTPFEASGTYCPGVAHVDAGIIRAAKQAIQLGPGNLQAGAAAGASGSKTVTKRYAFEVRDGEDYWHAIQRLAAEVKWRAFCSNGIFYYVEELDLLSDDVWLEVKRPKPGIDRIRWEWDMGKPVAELTVEGRARAFSAPPGTVAKVTGEGPANGRYLVSDVQGSILVPDVSITCKKATKPLPEPAADTKTVKGHGGSVPTGSGKGADLVKWAKAQIPHTDATAGVYGCGGAAWCGCFVASGLEKACGIKVPFNRAWAPDYCSTSWGTKIASLANAQAGDICTWDWGGGGTCGGVDHVNIYMGNHQWIGGNQSDAVTIWTDSSINVADLVAITRPPGF